LLWINETNCYASCHWYNSKKEECDQSDDYAVVEFDELIDLNDEETEVPFYENILNALNTFSTDSLKNYTDSAITIFETDEMDEPTKIFELENGLLKIIETNKEEWLNNMVENIEDEEILSPELKKRN